MDYSIFGNIINAGVGVIFTGIFIVFYMIITPRLYWYHWLLLFSVVIYLLSTIF